ncbi:hypothetical protein B0I35DRAFT_481163 [Stachybotrys elegans]|uniref:Histone chaperone RTT106/FACT complex subunit SPT16-like middle domain-containing protein n=1 Tax=Stachybotrys elegans TaxID=80388 RepID=A0A8K0SLD2_9HYPO|nr:hypothetical protein B0I35DRAFT_481163 [Stachybotrys elegans]
MAPSLDLKRLGQAFGTRPDIVEGIKRAADSPSSIALFNEITSHVSSLSRENGEPAHKKRRVDVDVANGPLVESNAADEPVLLLVKEISVSVPQRKKFELCFTANHLYARAPGTTAPIPAITYSWRQIEYVIYVPVPDKAQVQHNYLLFPQGTSLPSKTTPPTIEPLVFTIPATAPKEGTIGGSEAGSAAAVSDDFKSLFHWAIDRRLKAAGNPVDITSANPNKFHSMVRQAHRPNEKAVHVSGFRGSKDGFLFFLDNGILWGFKKPLIFIPLNRIVAVSYTNILQITFNMVVEVLTGDGDATEELEFGMLDQQDYGGIDSYVKLNHLQDRSMAEQRKGKLQLAENKNPKKPAEGEDDGDGANAQAADDGLTELQRAEMEAEQQLQDDEDEDEEDYDPGSEGESEGSGSSSDEDDDDDDDDTEGDEEEEEEEGDEEMDEVKEEAPEPVEEKVAPKPTRKPTRKPAPKPAPAPAPAPAPVPAPAKGGWAAFTSRSSSNRMDVDEKFDVV